MILPAWKTNQPFTPSPPATIDIVVGQGVAVPCNFQGWANVLSSSTGVSGVNFHIFVASFPNNASSVPQPGIRSISVIPPEYIKRRNLFAH